jgi:hydroxymethylbilane synthase
VQYEGTLTIGTRKSKLALVQTEYARDLLLSHHPQLTIDIVHIVTQGDLSQAKNEALPSIGGKGLFTAELEEALADNRIDIAVHSLKDLPTALDSRFCIGAVPKRESVADALISREGKGFRDLPQGACVGTSSLRREAQVKIMRPDLRVQSIRGNIDTRIQKLRAPGTSFDAILLAEAGLVRIGRADEITETFSLTDMVPAASQGALGIQCRVGDKRTLELLAPLHDLDAGYETDCEREFLATLQAGCNHPLGCVARIVNGVLHVHARALSRDGSRSLEVSAQGRPSAARDIGRELGEEMMERGVKNLEL